MKMVAYSFSLLALSACGTIENSSNINAADSSSQKLLVFSRDLRTVDGDLVEIVLKKEKSQKYEANLIRTRTTSAGSRRETELLGKDLTCVIDNDSGPFAKVNPLDNLLSVACASDKRSLDGTLRELKIETDTEKAGFKASIRSTYFDRCLGKEVSETRDLSGRLMLEGTTQLVQSPNNPTASAKTVFIRDQRAQGGPLAELTIIKTNDEGFDAFLSLESMGSGGKRRELNSLGEGMECNFLKDSSGILVTLKCYIDNRNLDGALQEVNIQLQSDGSYNASHRVALTSIQTGQSVDHTEEIAKGLRYK